MTPVTVFIIEEHHEALITWHEAVRRGFLRFANRNTLLHVDAHADMKNHYLCSAIPDSSCSVEAVKDFTYQQLIISSFIIPAIYQRLFYEICWLVPSTRSDFGNGPKIGEKRYYYVRTLNKDKKSVIVQRDPFEGFTHRPWEDRSPFCFYHQTTAQPFSSESPVVVDIDLDYFCCSPSADAFERIEITADEYERCRSERYRKLNLHFMRCLEIVDGHYYLCINPRSPWLDPGRQVGSEDEILSSVQDFSRFLKTTGITPAFIDICRSRYSGYTPDSAWQFIEEKLLGELERLYELKVERLE